MESIVDVLMRRDGMTREDEEQLVSDCKDDLYDSIENGDLMYAEDICQSWFGLEPDYMMELL